MVAALTTTEYWDVDGTPLNTYAYNIGSLTGRTGLPGMKGEDQEQAYRPGSVFRPKVPDSRILSLGMWVQGSDPEVPHSGGAANVSAQFQSNLRMLQRLFYSPRRQFQLTKRWTDLDGSHVATALGQVVSPVEPGHGRNRAAMVIDIRLTDPFFYSTTPISVTLAPGATTALVNPGDDATPTHLKVAFAGPLTRPILRNMTANPDIMLAVDYTIPSGSTLTVDVASDRTTMGSLLLNSKIAYTGSIWPMEIFPGSNTLNLQADSGTGSCTVTTRPAYF